MANEDNKPSSPNEGDIKPDDGQGSGAENDASAGYNPSDSSVPEVEAEIVEEGSNEPPSLSESSAAGEDADDSESAPDSEPTAQTGDQKRKSTVTPGVILFCVFAVIAVSAILFWRIQGGGIADNAPAAQEEATEESVAPSEGVESDIDEAPSTGEPVDGVTESAPETASPNTDSTVASDAIDDSANRTGEETAAVENGVANDASEMTLAPEDAAKIANVETGGLKTAESTINLDADISAIRDALPVAGGDKLGAAGGSFQEQAKEALRSLEAEASSEEVTDPEAGNDIPGFEIEGSVDAEESASTLAPEEIAGDANAPLNEPVTIETVRNDTAVNEAPISDPVSDPEPVIDTAALEAAASENQKLQNDLAAMKEAFDAERSQLAAALDDARRNNDDQRSAIETLKQEIEAVRQQGNDAAANQTRELAARLQKIENEELAPARQRVASAGALKALEAKIKEGAPFENAMARFEELTPNAPSLATLRPFAETGISTVAALKSEFSTSARAALAASRQENATGIFSALKAQAVSLFAVRPAEPKAGDSAGAVMSRAEYAVENDDFETAIMELKGLPDTGRAAMEGWSKNAATHVAANAVLDDLNQFVLGAMSN